MSQPVISSYRDAIDILDDHTGGTAQAATQRDIRATVQRTYTRMFTRHKWRSLQRIFRIETQAPFNDGTIQYHSNTNTLVLTPNLSTGWPSWAAQGSVLVGSVIADVVSVANDNVTATLDPNLTFQAGDIAAGTSYQLFQDQYPLPYDFRMADMPVAESQFLWGARYVEPQAYMTLRRIRMSSGIPVIWTVMPSTRYLGTMVMCLNPWPYAQLSEDFTYVGRGRPLKYTGFGAGEVGTFTASANTNTVTANAGTFSSDMVGSLFRTRLDRTTPDGVFGLNQYVEQRTISGYTDSTHVTLDANLANSYTANAYVVSDPLDMPTHMIDLLVAECQYTLATQRQYSAERVQLAKAEFDRALMEAEAADNPVAQKQSCYDQNVPLFRRLARWSYSSADGG